jgi:uncharacterized membrane protein YphA (DoxX/SURF4 family)
MKNRISHILSWVLQIVAAAILLQTLYFKFTAHPQSVELFTTLGVEPWGRVGTGGLELITSVLILVPGAKIWGALSGMGIMTGAILSHLFVIGIESAGDGGLLFGLAITVFLCCISILALNREQVGKIAVRIFPVLARS